MIDQGRLTPRVSLVCCLAAAAMAGFLPHESGTAQMVSIPDEPQCGGCRFRFDKIMSVGDLDGPGALPGQPWAVAQTSKHVLVTAGLDPTEILVFDRGGTFVRTIGRAGEGPGEYRTATALVVMPGDTVHVFDRRLRRQTVLSPNFEVVRTSLIQIPAHDAWPLDSRRILVNGQTQSRNAISPVLHVLLVDGTSTESFGAEGLEQPAIFYAAHPELAVRRAAPQTDGTFWTAPLNEYRLEQRALDGSVLRTMRRDPSWFPTWQTQPRVSPDQPPVPRMSDMIATLEGDLLTLIAVPSDDWRDAVEELQVAGGRTVYRWDPLVAYDTVLEVIDPEAAQLIATQRVPFLLHGFVDSETVYVYVEDESGHPRIDFYRLVWET